MEAKVPCLMGTRTKPHGYQRCQYPFSHTEAPGLVFGPAPEVTRFVDMEPEFVG